MENTPIVKKFLDDIKKENFEKACTHFTDSDAYALSIGGVKAFAVKELLRYYHKLESQLQDKVNSAKEECASKLKESENELQRTIAEKSDLTTQIEDFQKKKIQDEEEMKYLKKDNTRLEKELNEKKKEILDLKQQHTTEMQGNTSNGNVVKLKESENKYNLMKAERDANAITISDRERQIKALNDEKKKLSESNSDVLAWFNTEKIEKEKLQGLLNEIVARITALSGRIRDKDQHPNEYIIGVVDEYKKTTDRLEDELKELKKEYEIIRFRQIEISNKDVRAIMESFLKLNDVTVGFDENNLNAADIARRIRCVAALCRNLKNTLTNIGVEEFRPDTGARFDENEHEAEEEGNLEKGTINRVTRSGFKRGNDILARARVEITYEKE